MRSVSQIIEVDFDISYTSKEITPWGGMILLKQMLQKIGSELALIYNCKLPFFFPHVDREFSTPGNIFHLCETW